MPEIPISDERERPSSARRALTASGLVTLPESWESERYCVIPPHHPERVHLDMRNVLVPDRLNGIARFALERASFLWDLAEEGRAVVLSPEQVSLLANAFENIGAELGDGVGGLAAQGQEPVSEEEIREAILALVAEDAAGHPTTSEESPF